MNSLTVQRVSILVVWFLIAARGTMSADSVTGWIGTNRSFYMAGHYQGAIRAGLSGIDGIFQKQAAALLGLLPVPDGFTAVETNASYSFSLQSGILDYSLQARKSCSNDNALITLTADTSVNTIERTMNLLRSYDYLSDKGGIRKTVFKGKRTEWTWLTDGDEAFVLPVLNEKDDLVQSGLHLKISFVPFLNLKQAEREKMMESRVKEILEKLKVKDLANLMK